MAHYGTNRVPKWRAAAAVAIVTGLAFAGAQALAASNAAPKPSAVPTVEGKFQVGETVSATPGTWANAPTEFNYQWLRCNASGGGCANVAGATAKTYGVRNADAGYTLRAEVTARNDAGRTTVNTDRSEVIQQAPGTTTTVTTTATTTVPGNRAPSVRLLSLRVRRNRVYV